LAAANWDGSVSIWDATPRARDADRGARVRAALERAPSWSLDEAETAGPRHPFAVAFHLRRAQRQSDPDFLTRLRFGDFLLTSGATNKAIAEYAAGFSAGETSSPVRWLNYARALLLQGVSEGHRRLCNRLWARFGTHRYRDEACAAIHACVLAPTTVEPVLLVRRAREALGVVHGDPQVLYILGLAHYRAGEHDEAIRRLKESIKANPDGAWLRWPALALAHQGRGDGTEARRWLGRAEKWLQDKGATGTEPGALYGAAWVDFQILTREARATLAGAKR
jgi:tetratricopeptide (TPR) repeat protein